MNAAVPVITVDGPGGTGKGTLCSYLAGWLDWHLLDSGALYRIVAHVALQAGTDLHDETQLASTARDLDVVFSPAVPGQDLGVHLQGTDVATQIRTEECGRAASIVAALPAVRAALLERQHAFRRAPGLVADGRDMGTVVFPTAELKIYLTASPGERAQRRYKQLKEKDIGVNLRQLLADINERDARDTERDISPLRAAEDAVIIDTTGVDIKAMVDQVASLVRETFPNYTK
ncbi:MAG: (d)CMP kinase [Thiotrichales bacterium]|nr:(d)CMP kinase [Thiotrichales bacterium]